MKAAFREVGIVRRSCVLHRLHNSVRDNIPYDGKKVPAQRFVSDMTVRCRKIAGHFNHSRPATENWKQVCKEVKSESEACLIQDCKTRWDYTYLMLESFQKQKKVVKMYCSEYSTPETLTNNDWELIPPTLFLLKPFREITLALSWGGLLSMVYPRIRGLDLYLVSAQSDKNVYSKGVRGGLAVGLAKSVSTRFNVSCVFFFFFFFLSPSVRLSVPLLPVRKSIHMEIQ